jgi:cytochrome c-type biogenesis protein CcmH
MKKLLWTIPFVLALAFLWKGHVAAQGPTPSDDEVNAIAKQLFCPVCENTPLDVCPTQACAQWRALIRQKLAEGWTEAQIKQYFVEQYGARVLSEPPRTGLNWLVYIIPPLMFIVGVVILARTFRKPNEPTEGETTPTEAATDDYAARFEDEVKKRK